MQASFRAFGSDTRTSFHSVELLLTQPVCRTVYGIARRLLVMAALSIGLFACAEQVPPLNFSVPNVGPTASRLDADLRAITVTPARPDEATGMLPIDGGTANVWKEALQEAINRTALFDDESRRRVTPQVKMLKINVPSFGASFAVDTEARYELIDRSSGAIIVSELVSSQGKVPGDFAFMGVIRAREAVNRSVQNNIALFLQKLQNANVARPLFQGRT